MSSGPCKILSMIIKQALMGEKITIARDNTSIIRFVPYGEKLPPRIGGQLKNLISISKNFDDPLPSELLGIFYNG
jgi:antitoxin (DNA-binding transcriptional repressor) of toxin-antitoxin stability system